MFDEVLSKFKWRGSNLLEGFQFSLKISEKYMTRLIHLLANIIANKI